MRSIVRIVLPNGIYRLYAPGIALTNRQQGHAHKNECQGCVEINLGID